MSLKFQFNKALEEYCSETTTDGPERGGASGVQPTEQGTRHHATY